MAGDGYTVQIDELGKLIDNLDTAAERITQANKALAGHSFLGELGNEALGNSGMSFEDEWEYGIGKLGDAAEEVTDGLTEARKSYQKVEEMHAELFGDIADGLETPPLITDENDPSTKGQLPDSDSSPGIVGGGYTGGIQDRLDGRL